jgi:signal transduction histidine kinase
MRSYIRFPLVEGGRLFGSLLLASDRAAAFSTDQVEVAREVADHLAIAIRQALLLDEVRAAKGRLEALSRQLIRAQEEEQRRIARELHDEVGQSLTAVKIVLDRLAGDPSGPDAGRRLEDAAAMTAQALEQVRDLSRLLRPSLLDDLGLAEALRALVEGLAERTGLGAEAAIDEIGRVDPEVETACYRLAQETLTNAIKHARASRLRVALHRIGDDLELVVDDDGIGFDVAAAMARAVGGSSLGILGMQERARLAGGWAEIGSRPGLGTQVRARVPARGRTGGLPTEGKSES